MATLPGYSRIAHISSLLSRGSLLSSEYLNNCLSQQACLEKIKYLHRGERAWHRFTSNSHLKEIDTTDLTLAASAFLGNLQRLQRLDMRIELNPRRAIETICRLPKLTKLIIWVYADVSSLKGLENHSESNFK